jgi:multiple sugar transport system substrate-binding protein
MRKRMVLAVAVMFVMAACTAGGSDEGPIEEQATGGTHQPVTLNVWGFYTEHELENFTEVVSDFEDKYPWITVNMVPGKQFNDIVRGINSGTPIDVAIDVGPDNVAKYCSTGAWVDLNSTLESNGVDFDATFPASVKTYTNFEGKQCALPMLTDAYGLYYNKDLLEAAGYTEPPKTLSELTEMAKKLTTYNADGSIDVIGFNPLSDFYEGYNNYVGNAWGADWYDDEGKSAFASDPAWAQAFRWDKDLVDYYGYDNLVNFKASLGGDDSEWNEQNGFQVGRVAMLYDGEWRTVYDQEAMDKLNYGTAPFPVADDHPELYGSGLIGGTVVGIPRTSENQSDAWLFVKTLTTDPEFLESLATKLGNGPTTNETLESTSLNDDAHFKTFIDIFSNPNSSFKEMSTLGTADATLEVDTLTKWEAGKITDLDAALEDLASSIDQQLELG